MDQYRKKLARTEQSMLIRLKIRCPKGRAGSTPALGTIKESNSYGQQVSDHKLPVFVSFVAIVPTKLKTDFLKEGLEEAKVCLGKSMHRRTNRRSSE